MEVGLSVAAIVLGFDRLAKTRARVASLLRSEDGVPEAVARHARGNTLGRGNLSAAGGLLGFGREGR